MIKDRFGLRAFGYDLDKNCENLSSRILEGSYKPQPGFKFYVPKASKTQRTKTLLMVEDAIVYQAIANVIAQRTYSKLKDHDNFVFGSVLNSEVELGTSILEQEAPNYFFFKFWKSLYQKFKNSVIKSIEVDKVKYKFETDITGFFDSIPHYNLLIALSTEFEVEDEILDMLSECLNLWSGTKESKTPGVGIPQGPQPSFFLANLLLYSLDSKMIGNAHKYYRYMDDIKIYGYEEQELLDALVTIDCYTKSHGLSINSKKTSIEEIDPAKEDATAKELKKMDLFSLYENDEPESLIEVGKETNKDAQLEKALILLSEQGNDGDIVLVNPSTSVIDDPEDIISFWNQNIKDVEKDLAELVRINQNGKYELVDKVNVDDIDFIRLSAKYGVAQTALKEMNIETNPNVDLIPIWLFAYKKYFWRANIFGGSLMHYRNNYKLKAELIILYKNDFRLYEWVRYSIITTLAISHRFDDRELRTCFYPFLKEEESALVKISLYRLLFNHSRDEQFNATLKKELRREQNGYLRMVIMDFIRTRDFSKMIVTELLQSIAI
ncbi:RNA-directed DNA polymerase [Pontibacter sp. H249]|uniref:RNA-directed DNA polymerase n=1 Tax=Pontibacter sp. H249 TaxID=3133420 RepID=UPI0030C5A225